MNRENIRNLINVLKQSETFTMEFYHHGECGSPACIAGHIFYIMKEGSSSEDITLVEDFLGVSIKEADCIIKPEFDYAHWDAGSIHPDEVITKGHAIRMLERLLETGKVDWKGTKEEPKVKEEPQKFDMKEWLEKIELGEKGNKEVLNA